MKINNRCHICLEDYRCSRSIKLCCKAYICKECIIDLINNDFDKCPICKNDLEIGDNCKFNCCIFPYNYFRNKFNNITKNIIKKHLKKILNSNPSNDVFEVVSKALNQ